MDQALRDLESAAQHDIELIRSPADLEHWRVTYLGRKGQLAKLMGRLGTLSPSERGKAGQAANALKIRLLELERRASTQSQARPQSAFEQSLPGLPAYAGRLHPLTLVTRRIVEIFRSMGFEVLSGPEVEETSYNFDKLNIPDDHPARDLWDTFSIAHEPKLVLRTHTSPVQLRAMETRKPPVRLIVPGRVYRHEATDASHESTLTQCEGLVIDQGVRLTDLFGTVNDFLSALFERPVVTRHRPSFFPFVEPGAEIIMRCTLCDGQGCPTCGRSGWLELGGQGMVHPTVLRNMGLNPARYRGFAFGFGIERIMMLLYGIPDIRVTLSGDLRFQTTY
jgi:phenylalanyl-tRNA synthetase alpha chain